MIAAAVVGVGYLGRFHAQKYAALAASGQIQFAGVFDLQPERAKTVAEELNVPVLASLAEIAKVAEAVTVATTTQTHFEVAEFFLQRGLHVNVEKPIAATVEQARALCRLAKQKNVQLCVGHSERFNACFEKMRTEFPKPRFVEFRRHNPYKLRGSDVSVVLDLMIHDLDLVFNWASKPTEIKIETVAGSSIHSPSLDWAECVLSTGRQTFMLSASRVAKVANRAMRGVAGSCSFSADFQSQACEISRWTQGAESAESDVVILPKRDHLMLETEAFFAAIRGERPVITGEDGAAALELATTIEHRIREGK